MNDKSTLEKKAEKPKKKKLVVRCDRIRVHLKSGIIVNKYKNDVIDNPTENLLKIAATPSGRRLFAIIEE